MYTDELCLLEILRGLGISIATFLKGMYQAQLDIVFRVGGGGGKPNNDPWCRYGYFLEPHIAKTKKKTATELTRIHQFFNCIYFVQIAT